MQQEPVVRCQQCGDLMEKTKIAKGGIGRALLGLVMLVIGLVLLSVVPIGTIIGLCLIVSSFFGYHKKVWECPSCGYHFDRSH